MDKVTESIVGGNDVEMDEVELMVRLMEVKSVG